MKRPWQDFSAAASQSFVRDLLPEARRVSPADLVAMASYRKEERMAACGGRDPIRIVLAYAQDELVYNIPSPRRGEAGRGASGERPHNTRPPPNLPPTGGGTLVAVDAETYRKLPRGRRLNKFGLAYRRDATFWQHRTLADIVVGAAIHLYRTQGWTTVLYDGLRTVEGAFSLYNFATDKDIADGLLALPGQSAHNKGLAVDSMMEDRHGNEVPMGGHFDHLDMTTNLRTYTGFSKDVLRNRIIREAAFLFSAFSQDLLVAPLKTEFWDDRLPENRADLWRVLDSSARVLGISLLPPEDEALRKTDRAAFSKKWESWSYADFLAQWKKVFAGHEKEVELLIGHPPLKEMPEFYHGNWHPLYDRDLVKSGQNLTLPAAA